MPSVTIIIPIYNRAEYLPRFFRSLASVDYEELEVLLVDNGSTDNSLSLCRSFAEDAPMYVQVLEERERGASCARNRGLSHCTTEWVYFFDCDDDFSPSFLQELMPQASGYDLVAFPTRIEYRGRTIQRAFIKSSAPASQILSATLNTQGMLLRTDFLRSVGGWDTRLSVWQDWELGVRLLLAQPRILWADAHTYHKIRVHADSITGPSMSSRRNGRIQALELVSHQLTSNSDHRALYFRRSILSGMLQREHSSPLPADSSVNWCTRFVGSLIQRYVAMGGRGGWRLAYFLS